MLIISCYMINDTIKTKSKEKKTKRRYNYEKTNNTLDTCHEKTLETFNKKYNSINSLEKELKKINKNIKNEKNEQILFDLKKKEIDIKYNISNIKSKSEEIDYLTKTSEILFSYYDSIENNDNVSKVKNINIIDFFNNNIKNIKSNQDLNRSDLLENYLACTDNNYINNGELRTVESLLLVAASLAAAVFMYFLISFGLVHQKETHSSVDC